MAVEYLYGDTYDPPDTEENDDGQSRNTGHTVAFGVDGSVKEWGLWVPASNVPANLKWRLWDDDTDELLAEVDVAALSPTPGTWARGTSADFTDPGDVAVLAAGTYVITKFSLGGHWVYSGSSTGSFDNGANITAVNGRYEGSSDGTSPPSGTFDFKPFVDVGFQAAGAGTEYTKSLNGSITASGGTARATSRALAGSCTATGAPSKSTSRGLAGSTTATGGIVGRAITRTLTGAIAAAGLLAKAVSRLLGGSVTASGGAATGPPGPPPETPSSFIVSAPHGRWHVGPPRSRWHIGPPKGE